MAANKSPRSLGNKELFVRLDDNFVEPAGKQPVLRPRDLTFLIPYASVLAGLYWLKSAWAALLLYQFGMAAVLLARKAGPGIGRLHIAAPAIFWLALVSSLLSGPALYLLWPLVKLPGQGMGEALARFGLQGTSFLLFAACYSSLHPLLEEMYWRLGDEPGHARYGLDLLFAGYHMLVLAFFLKPIYLGLVFLALASAGMAWRRMVAEHDDRLAAVLVHAAGDISTIAAAAVLAIR